MMPALFRRYLAVTRQITGRSTHLSHDTAAVTYTTAAPSILRNQLSFKNNSTETNTNKSEIKTKENPVFPQPGLIRPDLLCGGHAHPIPVRQ